ncbi:hypothetical protein K1719_039060 [Acacia pycnantha]|nr:hypothetical protein K1719_039060 [Acacia pycnantha]
MGAENPFVLKNLANDQSWDLSKSLTFGQDRIKTQNLESIGQKIAEKCGGVPLAIRAMGSMLSKIEENNWESIMEGDFWKLYESNDSIMPVLKLSYDQLSFELRQCFAYCSLYTKNWTYDKDDLIELWMAQGFLESQNEKQSLEDIGEEYVYTLLKRSFLEDVEMNEFGEIKYFKIHNLIHDLLQSVASSDCYLYDERRKIVVTPVHVSFDSDSNCSLDLLNVNRLRTMLGIQGLLEIDPSSLVDFKCLRSLNLSECLNIRDLPSSIGKMKHLRYLNLSQCENLTSLTKSVSNLVNLQTLNLMGCYALKFPIDWVTKLVSLRHLHINNCKAFEGGMPMGLEKLTALQSLSDFRVGNDAEDERKHAELNELKELNLRHELCIENLNLVRDVEAESKDVNLKAKKNLKSFIFNNS